MNATADRVPRAAALPAEERRAAIVEATLPLLLARGSNVTTRQIADAAGIAEGTIFRVFPDKEALLRAVIDKALDTTATEAAIAAIDPSLPFEGRLEAAVAIMQRRAVDIWRLFSAVADSPSLHGSPKLAPGDLQALVDLFEAERPGLRVEPVRAARALRALTLSASHPALERDGPMSPAEIVSVLLDGIRVRPPAPAAARTARRRPC